MEFLKIILPVIVLETAHAGAPVFSPATYSATVGINTTVGTTLATVSYSDPDPNDGVTLSVDPTSDGYSYFGFSGNDVILTAGLDVDYGGTSWDVRLLAVDNETTPNTGMATLSLTTYATQTTTASTTPAPPGYSWFDEQMNVILFGSFFAFIALMTGICILMCFRFHRIGTCLPRSCPEYRQCRASCRRQADCCPLPCVFPEHKPMENVDSFFDERETTVSSSLSRRAEPSNDVTSTVGAVTNEKSSMLSKQKSKVPPPIRSVTPISIGNVDLREAGYDGMRTPGFNAPMFTSYGGSGGISSTGKNKGRQF